MTTYDIAIIGGGAIGSSIAAHLALLGSSNRIALFERYQLGSGTTSKSSANVRSNYSHPELARMGRKAVETFQNFEHIYGYSAGFIKTGYVAVFGPADSDTAQANVRMQNRLDIPTYIIDPHDLRSRVVGIDPDGLAGAICEDEAGYAEPSLLIDAFASIARRGGVEIHQRTATRITRNGDNGFNIVTKDQAHFANRIVVAANVWTNSLTESIGIRTPLTATRHQIVMLHYLPIMPQGQPIFVDMVDQFYIRPDSQGRALIAATKDVTEVVDPDNYTDSADTDYLSECAEYLSKRWPGWDKVGFGRGYSGIYDVTPDWQPVLGFATEDKNLLLACGFSGHGLKLSPIVGRGVAQLLLSGITGEFDADLFSYHRFDRGELIRPPHSYTSGIPLR